jgi:hypothetical protein
MSKPERVFGKSEHEYCLELEEYVKCVEAESEQEHQRCCRYIYESSSLFTENAGLQYANEQLIEWVSSNNGPKELLTNCKNTTQVTVENSQLFDGILAKEKDKVKLLAERVMEHDIQYKYTKSPETLASIINHA